MQLSERAKKVLRVIGYVAFFLVALVLCIRLTLPTGQLREFVKMQIAERLGAESVTIEDISINGLFPSGATVENLEVTLPSIKIKTPDRGVDIDSAPRVVTVEELSFDGSLLGAASGDIDFEFEGKVQGGDITGGRVSYKAGSPAKLSIESMSGIALGSESLFLSLTGMDVIGTLSGKLDVSVPAVERDGKSTLAYEQMAATVELKMDEARMIGPVIDTVMNREPVRMGFTDVNLGTITIRAQSEGQGAPATGADTKAAPRRGLINFEEVSILGGDIEVMAAPKGNIAIPAGQPLKDGNITLHLAVKINDSWFDTAEKDRKDPTKMTKPNSGLRTMMTLGPLKQHVVDGQFGVSITGPIAKPQVVPSRPRTRVGTTPGSGGRKLNVDQPEEEEETEAPVKPSRATRTVGSARSATSDAPVKPMADPVVRPALGGGRPVTASPMGRPRPVIPTDGEAGVDNTGGDTKVEPTPAVEEPLPEVPGEPIEPGGEPGVEDPPLPE
jgi:type II secretion system protein N